MMVPEGRKTLDKGTRASPTNRSRRHVSENNSAGARKAAQALPAIAGERGLDILAAINLDAIADDRDGSKGCVIALGTLGKLLPTAHEEAWPLSRLPGPAIVTGFGPICRRTFPTGRQRRGCARLPLHIAAGATARYGSAIGCADCFAGISDMSFFGEATASGLACRPQ
ncbi:hypothetical protein NKJ72_20810 [Mesorhizobium sp. M0045]|uniref:hypothetical protein n=1 Tax=unclassified Mesorhizobium TaxID=325217 RepID=UPI003337E6CD